MTGTGAILAILAAVIPFGIWLYRTNKSKDADPVNKNFERYERIDEDFIKQDSKAATAHASADLDELERLQKLRGDQRGSAGDVRPGQ